MSAEVASGDSRGLDDLWQWLQEHGWTAAGTGGDTVWSRRGERISIRALAAGADGRPRAGVRRPASAIGAHRALRGVFLLED